MQAFVLTEDTTLLAPLLGQLSQWGVDVERVEHIPSILAELIGSPPSFGSGILGFTRKDAGTAAQSFEQLCSANALVFAKIVQTPVEGLPPMPWRRGFVSTVELPFSVQDLRKLLHMAGQWRPSGQHATKPLTPAQVQRRILVADDNATNRRVLERILTSVGHSVMLVADGEQALDALAGITFDVAILDVNMPVVSGIEAAKIYRFSSIGQTGIPLIALTADATPKTRELCLEAGIDACAIKPVEPETLLVLIEDTVREFHARATASEIRAPKPPKSSTASPIDADVLGRLSALGGEEFVAEIAESFESEACAKLEAMRCAAEQHDVSAFRDASHGIRSIATNVGAYPLAEICNPFQVISGSALNAEGHLYLERVETELERVRMALAKRAADMTARREG